MPKVKIEREQCIADGVCIAICPEVFEWGEDGKAQITEKYRVGGDVSQGEIPAELLDCVKQAAESCPVQIIKVEE